MSVKKLSFYLDSAQITLRSNHLPLKKFLEKNTMNTKVNNWAVELESQNINFEFIAGTKNVLADTFAWSHKSRATVDYTPISVEPHGPTRGV